MDSGEYISTMENMDPTLAELGDEFTLGDIDGECPCHRLKKKKKKTNRKVKLCFTSVGLFPFSPTAVLPAERKEMISSGS